MKHTAKKPEIKVYFNITSDVVSAEKIAARIPIAPTKIAHLGDPIPRTLMKHKHHLWQYSSAKRQAGDLEELVAEMLSHLKKSKSAIIRMRRKLAIETEVSCAIYTGGTKFPAINLSPAILAEIVGYNATLDIDIF